ncbi:UvrD-helicase domain-containing protein [Streptomyces sp. NBC_01465]|uniref:UvrD-helicase domain-containing protein n=1 Tax=Streptomyces sp. NBC_01465 TaxID=2903878 RepID=UPI002E2F632A|nr:UvrD-helicase domain-containing protein [Streptomyces sp. NBC_01465]
MGLKATAEQEAAREAFAAGQDLALVAGAGTGKTSTLVMMGSATQRRGLYVAFNRPIAHEAKARFGANVRCSTSHALAHRAVGRQYQDRLDATQHMPSKRTAQLLGLDRDLAVGKRRLGPTTLARLVMEMIQHFCYSTDEQIAARHMGRVNGLDAEGEQYLSQVLLRRARWAWDDICSHQGRLPFKHDHYLKMWALTRPVLPADFVLLDEAQDTNPVLEEIFLAQDAQRVCVGDPVQQIYEWRHAKDIMSGFPGQRLELTQSFRFGPEIAEVANRWLRRASAKSCDVRLGRALGVGVCSSAQRVTFLVRLGEPERQPVLVEGVGDGQLFLGEEEAHVDRPLGGLAFHPFDELDVLEDLALEGVQLSARVVAPLQVEVGPQDRLVGVDGVPGDGEVVELVVVDLDLLPVEVEQDGTVGEPFVVLEVPDQPGTGQRAADERAQPFAFGGHDGITAGQPLRPVALNPEVEHARVLSGRCRSRTPPATRQSGWGRTAETKQAPNSMIM